jgi:hypothetical protein
MKTHFYVYIYRWSTERFGESSTILSSGQRSDASAELTTDQPGFGRYSTESNPRGSHVGWVSAGRNMLVSNSALNVIHVRAD